MVSTSDCIALQLEYFRTADTPAKNLMGMQMLGAAQKYIARRRSKAAKEARQLLREAAVRVLEAEITESEAACATALRLFGGAKRVASIAGYRVPFKVSGR